MNNNTLVSFTKAMISNALFEVHTCLPGKIEKYDESEHKADVKPMIQRVLANGDALEMPVVANVPVVFPRTKKFIMHYPIKKDDGVLLVFSERSLDNYLSTGKDDPIDDGKKFDLTDAIAIPGFFSFNETTLAENNDDFVINFNDAKFVIDKTGKFAFGKGSNELLDLFDQVLDALQISVVPTAIGPQQLSEVTAGTILTIKSNLAQIKGSL